MCTSLLSPAWHAPGVEKGDHFLELAIHHHGEHVDLDVLALTEPISSMQRSQDSNDGLVARHDIGTPQGAGGRIVAERPDAEERAAVSLDHEVLPRAVLVGPA